MKTEKELLTIVDEDGNEKIATIILTHKRNGINYVIFEIEEEDIISAGRYDEIDSDQGFLNDIETDEEWELIEKLLDNYYDSLEETEEFDDEE